MKKRAIISAIALVVILTGLFLHYRHTMENFKTKERTPQRMRTIETGEEYWIMVDTETACCYLFGRRGGIIQLTSGGTVNGEFTD